MKVVAVIPARWGSTRFPGKPLAPILGRPMIAWVVEAALDASRVSRVVVATDHEEVARAAREAGAEALVTTGRHATGTDRVAEAARSLDAEVVLNLQGDEPALAPGSIDRLAAAFEDPNVRMATLAVRGVTDRELADPSIVKIVATDEGDALYFSRAPIPHRARSGAEAGGTGPERLGWRHVGTYGFTREALFAFVAAERTGLEELEDLEQLRALRLGWRIRVIEIEDRPVCVDEPSHVAEVETLLRRRGEGVAR